MKKNAWASLLCAAVFAASCTQSIPVGTVFEPAPPAEPPEPANRKWTFLIYMAADNDLESAALQDFNELEAGQRVESEINLLVLLDRHPAYDSTNGNWTGTRLYEIVPDTAGANNVIVSKRIACPPLGLEADTDTELDMANPAVLDYVSKYAVAAYPADYFALVFWGHGTGWRSTGTKAAPAYRGVAVDDTSSGFMGIADANRAVAERGFSVIGFDTCFGALLETAFEFRASAAWLAGSEGIIPSSGWNYTDLIERFSASDLSPSSFGTALVDHFSAQYAFTPGASVSFIDLGKIGKLQTDFELFTRGVADSIISGADLGQERKRLLDESKTIHALSYPCDGFIDIADIAGLNPTGAETLQESLSAAVHAFWSSEATTCRGLAVHLVPLAAPGVPLTPHSPAYTNGSGEPGQSAFVRASTGWVPTEANEGTLLDKIFYTVY